MYHQLNNSRRVNRPRTSSLCCCSLPPLRWLIVCTILVVFSGYLGAIISRKLCDSEKDTLLKESTNQMEEELIKLRKCKEDESTCQEKINDLQWQVETLKRTNAELNDRITLVESEYKQLETKFNEALQQNNELKSKHDELKTANDKLQNDINLGKNKVESQENPNINNNNPNNNNPNNNNKNDNNNEINDNLPHINSPDEEDNENPHMKNSVSIDSAPIGIPVLIFTYNRAHYLSRTLESIFSYLPSTKFPVFISQDGNDEGVSKVIESYASKNKVFYLQFDYNSDTDGKRKSGFTDSRWLVYHKIAAHYGWALHYLFDKLKYSKIIILEDDMEISPDFFSYFENLGNLLDIDSTLLCISAWNDNGQSKNVNDNKILFRTDVFPGLGWMLSNKLWFEYKKSWPLSFWDDWIREDKQTKGRSCIRPEINRVYTFGKSGSSAGQFYNKYLEPIKLNKENIDWSKINNTYIINTNNNKNNYNNFINNKLKNSVEITLNQLLNLQSTPVQLNYIIKYSSIGEYDKIAKSLGLMIDHKNGKPRTSYYGIVTITKNNQRIFITPKDYKY